MDRRVRTATLTAGLLVAATAGVVLHARVPAALAALTPFERLAVDSAAADSAAFESLPHGLSELLDLRDVLTEEGLAEATSVSCVPLGTDRSGEVRRRLSLRLHDSSTVILFAVADDSSGSLDRVEFLRRHPGQGQRGLTWEADRDRTSSTWWAEPGRGARRRLDRGAIPRGGPVPRVLRALGRRLLTLPCEDPRRTRR